MGFDAVENSYLLTVTHWICFHNRLRVCSHLAGLVRCDSCVIAHSAVHLNKCECCDLNHWKGGSQSASKQTTAWFNWITVWNMNQKQDVMSQDTTLKGAECLSKPGSSSHRRYSMLPIGGIRTTISSVKLMLLFWILYTFYKLFSSYNLVKKNTNTSTDMQQLLLA